MIACGLRRWTRVMKATISIGSDVPNTAALRQTTTMSWVAPMIAMPTTRTTRPTTHVATSPMRLTTQPDARPPAIAPTPCTETITETNVAGRSKASRRA